MGHPSNSITFDTPTSNLGAASNGAKTSGGAIQFQLKEPAPIDPTKFLKTPKQESQ